MRALVPVLVLRDSVLQEVIFELGSEGRVGVGWGVRNGVGGLLQELGWAWWILPQNHEEK